MKNRTIVRKAMSAFLALAMMLSMLPGAAFATDSTGDVADGDSGGLVTEITSADDLKAFADSVNSGKTYEGKTVTLTQDITLSGEWTPIGNGTRSSKTYTGKAFKGTFDGKGKTISGLTITSTAEADAALGLFGVVDGGTVKDLTLSDVNINVSDGDLVGGAIGLMVNGATADNITVNGSVTGHDGVGGIVGRLIINGTIKDCTNNASVTSAYGGIGGIVGKAYYEDGSNTALFASVDGCINNGTVTAPMYVGGIVGLARANITNCVNNGAVVGGTQTGGIVGQLIAAGAVSGNENKAKISGKNHMGGIIGDYTQSTAYTYYNVAINNNVNRGELAATEQCAAIMGCNNIDGFTAMTASGNVSYYQAEGLELFATPYDMVINDTNKFDVEPITVATQEEFQTALDECVAGTTIKLTAGVSYGTVLLRPVEGQANTATDCDYNSVYNKEMVRTVKNITIIGAEGATVDSIELVQGGDNIVWRYIDVKNLVIDGVTFTDKATKGYSKTPSPLCFNLESVRVDGLTVKNCTLVGDNASMNFVYAAGVQTNNSTFETYLKNIVITGNTVKGIARLVELREAENVTISGNNIKDTSENAIQLAVNSGKTYSGNVTITENTADSISGRIVRMAGVGDATVAISGNAVTNYAGKDADFIKADGITGTDVTITGNTFNGDEIEVVNNNGAATVNKPATPAYVAYIGTTGYATLAAAIEAANKAGSATIEIVGKATLTQTPTLNADINFVGREGTDAEIYADVQGYVSGASTSAITFKNLTLSKAAGGYIANAGFMNLAFGVYAVESVSYENCVFANGAYAAGCSTTFKNSTFKPSHDRYGLWAYGNTDVVVDGCEFDANRGIKMYAEGGEKDTALTVKNTDFSKATGKPAIVLTYGESVTLGEGNIYPTSGVFELDLDGAPNGTPVVTDDKTITCVNDNGACGVLVTSGEVTKIYTTVAQAGEVAKEGDTVTLLFASTETVELAEGVILGKNGYTADGVTVKQAGLSGAGTEASPFMINTVEDLILFRDSVNAGETKYNAKGVWVALGADIDLAGTTWARGIGDGINATFDGCFDGKYKTIKNLKIEAVADSDGYFCGGLFGYVYQSGVVIRNLVIENATVTAEGAGHNVGVLVGFANRCSDSVIENITLKGDIKVDAPNVYGVGGIVGYSFNNGFEIKNCAIDANDGSYIKGYSFVGGIIGYAYTNSTITGCSVKNIDIIGTSKDVGGIAGIALGNSKISSCSVADTAVSAQNNAASVLGAIASNGIVVENCTAAEPMVGGDYENSKAVAAKVGNKYYATLQDAITAAGDNETVELLAPMVVKAGETCTIDLKGKTVVYNSTTMGEAMITNKGNLTINDSVGTGVINYNYTGAADSSYGKGNYTISNAGTLTVNGGKITIANLSGHAKYPIDNNSTTGDAILVINGGHLYNYNTSAIRQFCNSTTYKNSVTITGGKIEGYCAVWVQNPGAKTVNGSLSITGGEIKSTAKAYVNGTSALKDVSSAIYCTVAGNGGAWSEDSAVSITGGIINENVSLAEDAPAAITIDEEIATFNGYVELPTTAVAYIGEVGYATLQAAVDAAEEGQTVKLIADVTVADGETITLDGINLTSPEGITLTNNGTIEVAGNSTLNIAVFSGSSIDLLEGAIIEDSTVKGPAYIAGNVTFRGHNTFTMLTDYGDYYSKETPSMWTVEAGGSLTLTKTDRYGLGYGDKVTVYGTLEEGAARTADRASLKPSINMHGGLVGMTNSASKNAQNSFVAENAYLKFGYQGDKSFGNKPGDYYSNYTFTFDNVVMDANGYKFYEDKGTSTVTYIDSDLLVGGVFMTNDTSSTFNFTNTKVYSKATSNGSDDKNQNAGAMNLVGSDITYNALFTNIGTINMDATSKLTAPTIVNNDGTITVDATNAVEGTVLIDQTGDSAESLENSVTVNNVPNGYEVSYENGDVTIVKSEAKAPAGKVSYRAYVNDSETREAIGVDLENVYAKESFVVKLLDANGNLLTTTTLKAGAVDAAAYTANIVLWGNASSSWDTEIHAELTTENVPATIEVWADGNRVDTYTNALGAGTNVDETEEYLALDCVKKPVELFSIASANMELGNELAMNFFVKTEDLTGSDYYAVVTKTYADGRDDVVVEIPYSEWGTYSDMKYFTFNGLAAKEMNDDIKIMVYNADGTAASNERIDSVSKYVLRVLDNQTDLAKTMLVDMLNYGAEAQKTFNYNVGSLANSGLSETQKGYATQTVDEYTDESIKGTGYVGASLGLESNIRLGIFFNNISTDMYAKVKFINHYGNEQSVTVQGDEFMVLNSTQIGVVIDEVVVADARQLVTCEVYNANDELVASASDSVSSYCARHEGTIWEAIVKFADSAKEYLATVA